MRSRAAGCLLILMVANAAEAQGVRPLTDTSEYRAATYGLPTHYCDLTRPLSSAGTGTQDDPWNGEQCQALPVCGNVVGVKRAGTGTPVALPVPSIYQEATFNPTASCPATNRLVYVTQFPAVSLADPIATNPDRTEIRTNGTAERADVRGTGRAGQGCYVKNNITFDGFYFNLAFVGIQGDQGVLSPREATGCRFLNFQIDGVPGVPTDMDSNPVLFRPNNTRDTVWSNFRIRNFDNRPTGGGLNQQGMVSDQYGDQNYLFEDFEILNSDRGLYPKGTANGVFNYGTIRRGLIRGVAECLRFNDFHLSMMTVVEHNVCLDWTQSGITLGSETSPPRNVLIHHNTIANGNCAQCSGPFYIKDDISAVNVTIRDNVLDLRNGPTGHGIDAGEARFPFPTTNFNGYYRGGAALTWAYNGRESTTLPAWRLATGQEANSRVLGSDPFVNRAGGDYRIRAGHEAMTASSTGGELGAYAGASVPPPPAPVDCVVSAWTLQSATEWSTCSSGTQTRTETWTRSVLTPASNGGTACPTLTETRTGTQACTVPPPPPACGASLTDYTLAGAVTALTATTIDVTWTVTGCSGVVLYRAETRMIRP